MRPHLVVHPSGEIYIKSSRTRRRFRRMLAAHVKAVLDRVAPATQLIEREQRLRVVGEELGAASEALSRVFGVHRVTRVHPIRITDLDALADAVGALAIDRVRGRTFAVRVKRRGKHAWSS
ncbi:MAG: THUMP domain-containing protein, partial [Myxococcota bacterium]|nr:THUMP domain-containing protein [Myxococcota bacterium]